MSPARVLPFGERALLVELADQFDEALVWRVRWIADRWEALGHGVAVPAYASVVLRFDPDRLAPDAAAAAAEGLVAARPAADGASGGRLVEIPTRYDGDDLDDVAERSGLSVDELVTLHTEREYRAYFLGFMPGFAYLGRLDPRIVAPRLRTPRARVSAGSVAVADGQTAVYPFASPGGWRLIGTTDLAMFDPSREEPALLRAGDRVRFVAR
ncbi:MAG TPA: 5-oxoprolinase subunit PxpB [Candidatus Limnocylindria bacterium]|nr:5-oxoprolinase subunit PxpB [Candidatus Limnocylindria bacterium]